MSKNKHDVPQFDDPQLNRLTQALQANPLPAPPLPAANKQQLRQRLLARATPPGWHRFRAALGTAVALIVLVSAVAFFWLVQAGQDTAAGPLSAARATSTPETAVPNAQAVAEEVYGERMAVFGDLIQLNSFSQAPGPYIVGQTLELTLIWELRQPAQQPYAAALHIFDAQGNLRQQVDQWLEWEDAQPTTQWPVGAARSVRHILPTAQLEPGEYRVTAVVYTDYPQKTQSLLTAEGAEAAELFTFTLEGAPEGAPDAPNDDAPDSVSEQTPSPYPHVTSNLLQIEQVDPPAGTLLTGPQPITITFSLQLNGVPTATIRAKVVEMMGGSFRGVAGNDVVVTPEDGRFTLTIPFTANELNGPANLGLYVEGRTDPNPRTLANLFIHMPGEVLWRYEPENGEQHAVIFNSATQKERHTAMITFEVSLVGPLISTDTGDTGILQLYIAHPNWAENGLIARDALPFSPVSGSTYHLTATPEEIRAATGTDNPVVVAAWALVTERETDLDTLPFTYTTFSACPMDLTRNDAFTCTP